MRSVNAGETASGGKEFLRGEIELWPLAWSVHTCARLLVLVLFADRLISATRDSVVNARVV